METIISLFSLAVCVVFFWRYWVLWKSFDDLCKDYGRLWHELKQLERKVPDDYNKDW